MLTEEVDEGLVLLGRILGWDPIDLTYASLLETGEGGSLRWDNKPVQKAPKKEDLDEDVSRHTGGHEDGRSRSRHTETREIQSVDEGSVLFGTERGLESHHKAQVLFVVDVDIWAWKMK